MEFTNGIVFVKEVLKLSFLVSCIVSVIIIALTFMVCDGYKVFKDGRKYFSTFKRVTGAIMIFVGFWLMVSFCAFARSESYMSFVNNLGLAESTGKYEVTVSAETNMNDFQERYEIIDYDYENGVYTIKLK